MKQSHAKKRFPIADLETLRAIADPLRMQIMELLDGQPQTVRQVAEKLGLVPGKLYYHIGTLEKMGLIKVTETRMVANMQEKTYAAAAHYLDVDPSLFRFSKRGDNEPIHILLSSTIDATREDLLRSLQARQAQLGEGAVSQSRRMIINRIVSNIPEGRVLEFQKRLDALLREFEAEDARAKTADQPYALTVAFYPTFYFGKAGGKGRQK